MFVHQRESAGGRCTGLSAIPGLSLVAGSVASAPCGHRRWAVRGLPGTGSAPWPHQIMMPLQHCADRELCSTAFSRPSPRHVRASALGRLAEGESGGVHRRPADGLPAAVRRRVVVKSRQGVGVQAMQMSRSTAGCSAALHAGKRRTPPHRAGGCRVEARCAVQLERYPPILFNP